MEDVDTQLGLCIGADQAEWAAEEAYEDYLESQKYGDSKWWSAHKGGEKR